MIDANGFRNNVGMIITNGQGKILWARRIGSQHAWQFPQGGLGENEAPIEAMYRELQEELGIAREQVEVIAESKRWLRYRLPPRFQRRGSNPSDRCIGQNQKWFLLKLVGDDESVRLDATSHPEFDRWRWVSYWYPIRQVIFFKRYVYRQALEEFAPYIFKEAHEQSE